MIVIFTDGAAKGNPGPGGYGAVLKFGQHRKELSEGFRLTTNNRMELLAVIRALQEIKTTEFPVQVYSDSKYVVDAIEKGWLWSWQKKGFFWLKGHAGHPENERCDQLAVTAAEQPNLPPDSVYEQQA
jgi:ribonuclease HI